MSDSEIKIVKTLRDCKGNQDAVARGQKTGLLYDYVVHDGGVVKATFKRSGWGNTWELYDNGLQVIKVKTFPGCKTTHRTATARVIDEMLDTYLDAKSENAIPTDADIEKRKDEAAKKAVELEAWRLEQDRIERIRDASEELYKAAKKLLEDRDRSAANAHLDFESLRQAVFKAENPRSAEG